VVDRQNSFCGLLSFRIARCLRFFTAHGNCGASTALPASSAFITAIRAIITGPRFSAAAIKHRTAICQCGIADG
jgi:hypothetical protein